jgi:hypothetical protein
MSPISFVLVYLHEITCISAKIVVQVLEFRAIFQVNEFYHSFALLVHQNVVSNE